MYVCILCKWDMCRRIFLCLPLRLKHLETRTTTTFFFFQMGTILKFDFQTRIQLHFSEENYLGYAKRHNFAEWQLHFPKQGESKNNWLIWVPWIKCLQFVPLHTDLASQHHLTEIPKIIINHTSSIKCSFILAKCN